MRHRLMTAADHGEISRASAREKVGGRRAGLDEHLFYSLKPCDDSSRSAPKPQVRPEPRERSAAQGDSSR
jgi:hypothetical protein